MKSRYCRCGNIIDRPGMARMCSSCVKPRYSEPPAHRLCIECKVRYSGRTRKYCTSFCRNTANNRDKQKRAGTVTISEKRCNKCGEVRQVHMFNLDVTKIDGLRSNCRICQAKKHEEWREKNPDSIRNGNLMRNYGISIEEYEALLAWQGGVCAICGKPPRIKRLAVDHDHNSGAIRALLCSLCNKHKVGNQTLEDALAVVRYLQSPPADRFFGKKRFVPAGKENPPKKRRKSRKKKK